MLWECLKVSQEQLKMGTVYKDREKGFQQKRTKQQQKNNSIPLCLLGVKTTACYSQPMIYTWVRKAEENVLSALVFTRNTL